MFVAHEIALGAARFMTGLGPVGPAAAMLEPRPVRAKKQKTPQKFISLGDLASCQRADFSLGFLAPYEIHRPAGGFARPHERRAICFPLLFRSNSLYKILFFNILQKQLARGVVGLRRF